MNTPPGDDWRRISAALDELLDLSAEARQQRLAELHRQDPAWAAELAGWLARHEALADSGFLEGTALPTGGLQAGDVLGAYTLERLLGEGGMGSVWLAHRSDGRYDGQVAIKRLKVGALSAAERNRFEREGRILARLSHPHIARLLDAGVAADGQPYLVLERVEGLPIDQWCRRRGLGVDELLRLFLQVLDAVAHAHGRLILHRDLKPSNVLVTEAGEVKLLDFGIARLMSEDSHSDGALTQQAGRAYTLDYAAPEQIEGGDMSAATDVHALGVLLFLLLSGRHPWRDDVDDAPATGRTLRTLQAVLGREAGRVSAAAARGPWPQRARALRGDLDLIVAQTLRKRPAERYANATELADDLQRHLEQLPIAARRHHRWHAGWRFVQRHRYGVSAAALAAVGLAVGLGLALAGQHEASRQQARAEDLIEFLLGDLPPRLRPVGRLDVLDAVGEKALAHYADQRTGPLDDAALGRRARALHLIGEIAQQRGQLERSAQVFAQAAAHTAELLSREPDQPQRLFDHAQSEFWVGQMARQQGRHDVAARAYGDYLRLASRLVALAPQQADWQAELAYAHQALGVLAIDRHLYAQAEQTLKRALDVWAPLAARQPALALEQATTLGWLAEARELAGDLASATATQQAKQQALARAPAAGQDLPLQLDQSVTLHEQARLLLALGQVAPAQARLDQALALTDRLVRHEPDNLGWLAEATASALLQAELHLARGQPDAAQQALNQAAPGLERLLQARPDRLSWQLRLRGKAGWLQARIALLPGAPAAARLAARLALQQHLAELGRHLGDGRQLSHDQQQWLAAEALVLGDLHQAEGRTAAARGLWRAAARQAGLPGVRQDRLAQALEAQALLRLGQAQDVAARVEALGTSAFRHPLWLAGLPAALPGLGD